MEIARYSGEILIKLNTVARFSINSQISNFMEIRPVGAELFHADRRKDRHGETSSYF
jgi:hypothetical protein